MTTCSLIIRCYNEEKHIGRLLNGIMEQTVKNIEIIIVDSGSTDATLTIASRYPVKILAISPNDFSFGRSLNLGCSAASAEFLVFASAHVYPLYGDWLEQLTCPFDDPRIALVYGRQCGDSTTRYSERRIFEKWFPKQADIHQDHPFCNNANAAVRRSVWQRLPYDETLTGLEDLDWAARVMRLGYGISYVAKSEVVHIHNETFAQVYNRYRREAIALRQIFPNTRFGLSDFARLLIANMVSDYYWFIRERAESRYLLDIPAFRLMQLWGTYRGHRQHTPVTERLRRKFFYPNSQSTLNAGKYESDREKRVPIEYDKIVVSEGQKLTAHARICAGEEEVRA